jgi:hypothetical protein
MGSLASRRPLSSPPDVLRRIIWIPTGHSVWWASRRRPMSMMGNVSLGSFVGQKEDYTGTRQCEKQNHDSRFQTWVNTNKWKIRKYEPYQLEAKVDVSALSEWPTPSVSPQNKEISLTTMSGRDRFTEEAEEAWDLAVDAGAVGEKIWRREEGE